MSKKEQGIYYTPSVLAEYMASPLIYLNEQTVLDPAYGEGALLLAAEKIFKAKNLGNSIHLYGCDTKPINGLLNHLPEANLHKSDFFSYPVERKFHTILMNPPYVRHHIQNEKKINKYRATYDELKVLNNSSDLWALFLVKAVSHLKEDGSIGAILPWAFLQADYSQPLRRFLSENFGIIEVVALSDKYFDDADERIVIVWLKQFGRRSISINIAAPTSIRAKIEFSKISLDRWLADRVSYTAGYAPDLIISEYISKYGFTKFSDHADVKIGVVTGAVDYFILTKKEANEFGIPAHRLVPIITNSIEFPKYLINGNSDLRLLVALKRDDHFKFRDFIQLGISKEYNLRSHSVLRDPWYSVNLGKVPDAFFHYRISKIPYLVPNLNGVQCTNAFHRIYFKNLTSIERKWIYVSILSLPAQLSIELNSKTYGRGILKIEPKSLKNTIVLKKKDDKIIRPYNTIIKLLAENKKDEAMIFATQFVCNELGIDAALKNSSCNIVETLRKLRRPNRD
ncbi:MAG: N-6 DNA methylase [Bacteroidales bacterium]|nr:N-6 DNA methylase [Bacteroidales bacterium]